MKKLLLTILFVLMLPGFAWGADQVDFPDIYIDADAGDGGVGSEADPYNDFAEEDSLAIGAYGVYRGSAN